MQKLSSNLYKIITGDERIELPPKVLETPIIPFDQSPIYRKNLTPAAALNFPGTFLFCTFRISHRKRYLLKPIS